MWCNPPKDAIYKCMECGLKWLGHRGPLQGPMGPETICPRCQHPYQEWLNYEEITKA